MNKLFIVLWLSLCASYAGAQANVQVVHEVAQSTNTIVQSISLCQGDGALNVVSATSSGTLAGHFGVEVYNLTASTNTVNCGFDLSLSTSANSAWYGREVLAGTGVLWQKLSKRILYCMTQNSGGCTRLTITQIK